MVAIKQVTHSASTDIRTDEPAAVSRPEKLRSDNGQAVKSVQQEVQKKMAELLARAKQRKKQAEEQLSPSGSAPMMALNSLLLSKQIALPNIAQQPGRVSVQKPETSVQEHKSTEQLQAKPIAGKPGNVVTTEVLTQPNVFAASNAEQPQPRLVATTKDNPEKPMVSVASLGAIRTEHNEEKSYSSVSQDMPDMSRSAVEQPIVVSSEPESELTPSLPLTEKKDSSLSNDRTPVLTSQQLAAQPLATQAPTVTQPEEVKTTPQAVMTAVPEKAESDVTAGRRTLSYTFTQWNNSPMVKFELSQAGELTAMTDSVEVQQALQNNHHLLESENPLHFRDERQDEQRREQQQSEQEDEE
ncbi:TPA: type III secretion system needle length determinant, SpaN/EivJ family [Yersinia enterocolitica]|uniref:SpaN/EivJ family type III secretion system needle length determinant n=1 Tax=Yersinia artesiana TaxID=2890315 RepID=UPI001583BD90|nr:type III secretion system needle length determinant, SpaN/EivJ family [Yersinia artesiana]